MGVAALMPVLIQQTVRFIVRLDGKPPNARWWDGDVGMYGAAHGETKSFSMARSWSTREQAEAAAATVGAIAIDSYREYRRDRKI